MNDIIFIENYEGSVGMRSTNCIRPVVSSINPVPSFRAYGVTKKEGFFAKLNDMIATVYILAYFGLRLIIVAVGLTFIIAGLGYIGKAITIIAVSFFVYFKLFRTLRKRIKFIVKLNKLCRREGYILHFCRGFFGGLRFNTKGIDFTVDTPETRWCVRFATVRKYYSHVTFIGEKILEIKTNITKNHIKQKLGWDKPKIKSIKYDFSDDITCGSKNIRRVLLFNPVPIDISCKNDKDSPLQATGWGSQISNYYIFNASKFLETISKHKKRPM